MNAPNQPSDRTLNTRQVCELVQRLTGRAPTQDQVRQWCRKGYIAPQELAPIYLEHIRNRQGHYEMTETAVRRFIQQRARREADLVAFVKWCNQQAAANRTQPPGVDDTPTPKTHAPPKQPPPPAPPTAPPHTPVPVAQQPGSRIQPTTTVQVTPTADPSPPVQPKPAPPRTREPQPRAANPAPTTPTAPHAPAVPPAQPQPAKAQPIARPASQPAPSGTTASAAQPKPATTQPQPAATKPGTVKPQPIAANPATVKPQPIGTKPAIAAPKQIRTRTTPPGRGPSPLDMLAQAYASYTASAAGQSQPSKPSDATASPTANADRPGTRPPRANDKPTTDRTKPQSVPAMSTGAPSPGRPTPNQANPPEALDTRRDAPPASVKPTRPDSALPAKSPAPAPRDPPQPAKHSARRAKPVRQRPVPQVSRFLWAWVSAILLGAAGFAASFFIQDDFGAVALSSVAVAATGMSGLWWLGK